MEGSRSAGAPPVRYLTAGAAAWVAHCVFLLLFGIITLVAGAADLNTRLGLAALVGFSMFLALVVVIPGGMYMALAILKARRAEVASLSGPERTRSLFVAIAYLLYGILAAVALIATIVGSSVPGAGASLVTVLLVGWVAAVLLLVVAGLFAPSSLQRIGLRAADGAPLLGPAYIVYPLANAAGALILVSSLSALLTGLAGTSLISLAGIGVLVAFLVAPVAGITVLAPTMFRAAREVQPVELPHGGT